MSSKFKHNNGFITDEILNAFGREFYKNEVLWKPKPKWNEFQIQSINDVAYRKIALALNLSMEAIHELSDTFPAACLNLMSRYEMRRRRDAECRIPDWLKVMAEHFRRHNKFMKRKKSTLMTRRDLVRALYKSARAGLSGAGAGEAEGGTQHDASPLQSLRTVADFAARYCVKEKQVLTAWCSVHKLCVLKLHALLSAGDRRGVLSEALRMEPHEWEVTDLALLHDHRLSQIKFMTPAKLRSLVLLLQLVIAAKDVYDREKQQRRDDAMDSEVIVNGIDANNINIRDGSDSGAHSIEDVNNQTMIDISNEPRETTKKKNSTLSDKYKDSYRTQNQLKENVMHCKPRRQTEDISDATVEESSDNELHTELDLEPDINVISSDMSDDEISNNLLNKNQTEEPGDNDEVRYRQKESNLASNSQDSETSTSSKTYCYEELQSSLSEEQRVVWALVYTDFIKRGFSASLVSLQHRWLEVLHLARTALLQAWESDTHTDKNVHPLLLVVAHRFPEIVTEYLPPWKRLVLKRQIVLESDIKDSINKYQENENVILNITENLDGRDLVKEYVNNNDLNDVNDQSKGITTNKHLSYQKNYENPSDVIDNINKVIDEEFQPEYSAVNNELNVDNHINTMLEQIDPTKAKISIIVDEDSDEDPIDDTMDVDETTANLENLHVLNDEQGATYLREENTQTCAERCKKLIEIAMKNIEEEFKNKLDSMNSPTDNRKEVNENNKENNELPNDKETFINDLGCQDELGSLQGKEINALEVEANSEYRSSIDEKLLDLSRVVITPIEHLSEWKKHSRNGVIKCRNFSVRNFTKPVTVNSNQLYKCRPFVNMNRHTVDIKHNNVTEGSEGFEDKNNIKNEVKIKFEGDLDIDADVNNGIIYQKYIECYGMPDHIKNNRINLTKKLKLSRTYFSLKFWSLDRNIELMKLCKPMDIKLSKALPEATKRVELSDINEVPLSASPQDATSCDVQISSASHETVKSIINSNSSNSVTTRQTNNSLSSAMDSSELLRLLTNYTLEIPKKKKAQPTTKNNLMDSIIETMRLGDENNVRETNLTCTLDSLQQARPSGSQPTELSVNSCNTISYNIFTTDKSKEFQKNPKFNSINNSVLDATVSKIHITSAPTKDLHIKHTRKTINNTNQKNNKMLNVCDLKNMIILMANNFDTKIKQVPNDDMKLNRSSINLHLKKFEKQQRVLIKDITKLNKILPGFFLNMEPKRKVTKNTTPAKKLKKNNRSKSERKNEKCNLANENTDIIDISNNSNPAPVDEDCEPTLVIDEENLKLRDNIDLNNSKCNINMNKNIQETFSKGKSDKKENNRKKAKKKNKQSKKIPEEEKPMLNEYQEWQRQKTMALKYFTLPMTDNKLTSKETSTQQSTQTQTQSNACQTTIPIKRKSTKYLATKPTASDNTKRPKCNSNDIEPICISDSNSDDEVQITGCSIPQRTVNANVVDQNRTLSHNQSRTVNGNQLLTFNDPSQKQANQNICVINRPVAAISQPLYLVINSPRVPIASQNVINTSQDTEKNNNPVVFPVFPNAALPQTEISPVDMSPHTLKTKTNSPCQKVFNNNCKCLKCQSTRRDELVTSTLDAIQNVTSQDSTNNKPSSS